MGKTTKELVEVYEALLDDAGIEWPHIVRALAKKGLLTKAYLYGPPGTGKTHSAINLTPDPTKVLSVTLSEDRSAQEMFGMFQPVALRDDTGKVVGTVFEFKLGPLATAFKHGLTVVVNEVRFVGEMSAEFNALCDDPSVATLTLPTGEVIRSNPDFKIVFTDNLPPEEVLEESLQSRFPRKVYCPTPSAEALASIGDETLGKMVLNQYLSRMKAKDVKEGGEGFSLDLRKAKAFVQDKEVLGEELAADLHFHERAKDFLSSYRMGVAPSAKKAK